MIDVALVFLLFAVLFAVVPAALGGLRNARGIFVAYIIAGMIVPAALAFTLGPSDNNVFSIVSPQGAWAVMFCTVGATIAIATAIATESAGRQNKRLIVYGRNATLARLYSYISILMSVVYLGAMSVIYGGVGALVVRLYMRVVLNNSLANTLSIISLGSFVFAVLAISFGRDASRRTRLMVWAAAIVFFVQSLILGGRLLIVMFFIAVFYTRFIKLRFSRAALSGLVALLLIGSMSYFVTNWRHEAQLGVTAAQSRESNIADSLTGLTFVDHVAASISYAEKSGHDGGALYLNAASMFIPRDLWPDKPRQVSILMRYYLFGDYDGGVPPGIFGEAYIAFGVLGMLAAGLVLGLMLGAVDRATAIALKYDCRMRSAATGMLAPLVAFALVRGGFDVTLMRACIPLFWLMVAAILARYHIRTIGSGYRRISTTYPRRPATSTAAS